jgi:hypothetical protein
MTLRQFGILSSEYLQLLQAIRAEPNRLACEWKPEFWFPEDIPDPVARVTATTIALAGCRSCPIMEQCFTYALERNEKFGIWGGSLPSERI